MRKVDARDPSIAQLEKALVIAHGPAENALDINALHLIQSFVPLFACFCSSIY